MSALPLRLRFLVTAAVFAAASIAAGRAGDDPGALLASASDSGLSLREREYSAKRLLMIPGRAAPVLLDRLRDEASPGMSRRVAAGLLGKMGIAGAEMDLCRAAAAKDYFLADAASEAMADLYARLGDGEILDLLKNGRPLSGADPMAFPAAPPASLPGDGGASLDDAAAGRALVRAAALAGLAARHRRSGAPVPGLLLPAVWDALNDSDRRVRLRAVLAAERSGSDQAAERLAALLYLETDPTVLRAALAAMATLRPPDFGGAVERHAAHSDPMVSLEAQAALFALGYGDVLFPSSAESGGRPAAEFVTHPSTPVRRRAIEVIAGSKDPRALEFLLSALGDRVGRNRAAAARALGEAGMTAASGKLRELLTDGRPEVRVEAAVALDRLGVLGVEGIVADGLGEQSPAFRRAAAEALGRMGAKRSVPLLLEIAAGDDAETACVALEALAGIGDRSAGEGAYRIMRGTKNPVVADSARIALSVLYGDDPGEGGAGWDSWALRNMRERPLS